MPFMKTLALLTYNQTIHTRISELDKWHNASKLTTLISKSRRIRKHEEEIIGCRNMEMMTMTND